MSEPASPSRPIAESPIRPVAQLPNRQIAQSPRRAPMRLDIIPERPCLPVGEVTSLPVLIRLTAPTVPQMARKPLNLCLVIDRSGSTVGCPRWAPAHRGPHSPGESPRRGGGPPLSVGCAGRAEDLRYPCKGEGLPCERSGASERV